jgi:hypothetical protein
VRAAHPQQAGDLQRVDRLAILHFQHQITSMFYNSATIAENYTGCRRITPAGMGIESGLNPVLGQDAVD